jgi:hypothetical protein
MKIAIVSLYTDEINEIVSLTAANQKAYATKWGYEYYLFKGRLSDRHPAWDKILATKNLLKSYDWVLWIDSDAIFVNFAKRLESYIKPDKWGVFGPDPNPNIYVNTGVFLIKNCEWGHTMLDNVWNHKTGRVDKVDKIDPYSYSLWPYEQGPFNELLKGDHDHYRVEGHEFNSHPNFKGPKTFICHYMGARTDAQRYIETLQKIKNDNKVLKVPPIDLEGLSIKIN